MFAIVLRLFAGDILKRFLRGTFGKVFMGVGLILALVAAFYIWLGSHDRSVRSEALQSFNIAQQEQAIKDQKRFQKQMEQILADQNMSITELEAFRKQLQIETKKIIERLNSGDLEGGPSSPVLKESIRILEERRQRLGG